jgi:hypothetical protein
MESEWSVSVLYVRWKMMRRELWNWKEECSLLLGLFFCRADCNSMRLRSLSPSKPRSVAIKTKVDGINETTKWNNPTLQSFTDRHRKRMRTRNETNINTRTHYSYHQSKGTIAFFIDLIWFDSWLKTKNEMCLRIEKSERPKIEETCELFCESGVSRFLFERFLSCWESLPTLSQIIST